MNRLTTFQKIITIPVAFFMFVPGVAKFAPKFHGLFERQISLSEMPFPELSFFMGQWSEILIGLLLWGLLLFWRGFPQKWVSKLFVAANTATLPIMAVALYVHLHPAVPAEILPFEHKPPTLVYALMVLAVVNIIITIRKIAK